VPFCPGAKETEIVQLAPAAKVAWQVVVSVKNALPRMLVRLRLALPVLVRVTVWAALVVPLSCVPKARLDGDRATVAAAWAKPVNKRANAANLAERTIENKKDDGRIGHRSKRAGTQIRRTGLLLDGSFTGVKRGEPYYVTASIFGE
jgi:hypothetical protein